MADLEREIRKSYRKTAVWRPEIKGYKSAKFLFQEHPAKRIYETIFEKTGLCVFYESFSRRAGGRGSFLIGRISLRSQDAIQPFLYMATLQREERLLYTKERPGGQLEELFEHVATGLVAGSRERAEFLRIVDVGWRVD